METSGGPLDTSRVTVVPGATGVPAGIDCLTIVPAAALFDTCWMLSAMLFCPAQLCTSLMFSLTSGGRGMPATTSTETGRVCGHEVPAAGVVPATVPTASVVEATLPGVLATWRPCLRSSACAPASDCPVTGGTVII